MPLEEGLTHHSLPPGFPTLALGVEKYWRRRHTPTHKLPPAATPHASHAGRPVKPRAAQKSLLRDLLPSLSLPAHLRHLMPRLCEAPQGSALARLCSGMEACKHSTRWLQRRWQGLLALLLMASLLLPCDFNRFLCLRRFSTGEPLLPPWDTGRNATEWVLASLNLSEAVHPLITWILGCLVDSDPGIASLGALDL